VYRGVAEAWGLPLDDMSRVMAESALVA
jgi:hypothetical protein